MYFEFANPEILWLLLLLPVLILLRGAVGKGGSIIFSSVAIAKEAAKKSRSRVGFWRFFLTVAALGFLILALARPRLGMGYSEREESGIDIVLAVDVSGSMSALDFSTRTKLRTRLDAVKEVISQFINKRPNDRIGIVAFAANPFMVSPITLNHDWLIKNIDRLEIGIIDPNRTAIGSAIGMGVNRLRNIKNAKSRVIILLTDGENNSGQISPIAAAEAAASYDVKIYTIAAGRQGVVAAARLDENQNIIRDRNGNPVYGGEIRSQIDEETLKKIADITGGKFYTAQNLAQLEDIYNQIDALEKTKVKLRNFTTYEELFQWFAAAGLAVLALKLALVNTRLRTLP